MANKVLKFYLIDSPISAVNRNKNVKPPILPLSGCFSDNTNTVLAILHIFSHQLFQITSLDIRTGLFRDETDKETGEGCDYQS